MSPSSLQAACNIHENVAVPGNMRANKCKRAILQRATALQRHVVRTCEREESAEQDGIACQLTRSLLAKLESHLEL